MREINEADNVLTPFFRDKGGGLTQQQYAAVVSVMARYEVADIPKGYHDVFLDNSPARADQPDIYEMLESYVRTFTADDVRHKDVYLYSKSPGTGKTTTSVAILNEWLRRRFMYLASRGEPIPEVLGLFLDVNRIQRRYNTAVMSDNKDEVARIVTDLERAGKSPFLVIDDLAVRSASESYRAIIHDLVNERLTEELPTVYTSNVPPSDLASVFDERLSDRIGDMCATMTFKGTSKRGVR